MNINNQIEQRVNLILGYTVFVSVCYLVLFLRPFYIENYLLGTFISIINPLLESFIIVYMTNVILNTRAKKHWVILIASILLQFVFLFEFFFSILVISKKPVNLIHMFLGYPFIFKVVIALPLICVIYSIARIILNVRKK